MLVRRMFPLFMFVGIAMTSLVEAADESPVSPAVLPKASEAPKIDGSLDDAVWQSAKPLAVEYVYGKTDKKSESPRMSVKYTWDGEYLYLGYETFDQNLIALGTGEDQGPKENRRPGAKIHDQTEKVDVVEFFISFGDPNHFWELHHNALNQFNDVWCTVVDGNPVAKTAIARFGIHFGNGEYLLDDPDAKVSFKSAVKLKAKADGSPSTINDASDTDTGYTAEIRLPWLGLGAPLAAETYITLEPKEPNGPKIRYHGPWKMGGQEIMLLSVVQNGDLQDRYHHVSSTLPGGWFHKGTAHWPRFLLEGELAKKK